MFFAPNRCFLFAGVASVFLTAQLFANPNEAEIIDYFTNQYQISALDEGTKSNLLTLSDQEWTKFKNVFSMNSRDQISISCRTPLIRTVSQVPDKKREHVYDALRKLLMATHATLKMPALLKITQLRGMEVFIQQIIVSKDPDFIKSITERLVEKVRKAPPKENDNYFILQMYEAWCQVAEVPDEEKMGIFECTREDLDASIEEETGTGSITDCQRARISMLYAVYEANEKIKTANATRRAAKRSRLVAAGERGEGDN